MSIDLSTLECVYGRDRAMMFSMLQDNKVIGVSEIWHIQGINPILSKAFVKEEARRHGLWRFMLEKRLAWIQENTEAITVQLYIEKLSPIVKPLQGYGFAFTGKSDDEHSEWMVKQLKVEG